TNHARRDHTGPLAVKRSLSHGAVCDMRDEISRPRLPTIGLRCHQASTLKIMTGSKRFRCGPNRAPGAGGVPPPPEPGRTIPPERDREPATAAPAAGRLDVRSARS